MGIEQAYIERLKAARARMGMTPPRPVVTIPTRTPVAPAPEALVETTTKKWTHGRRKGQTDAIEARRAQEAATRFALAVEARERIRKRQRDEALAAGEIIIVCAKYFGVEPEILKKNDVRKGYVPYYRHVAEFMVKDCHPNFSLPRIGRLFGGFDHTTVLAAITKIQSRLDARDPRAVCDIANLRLVLRGIEMDEPNYYGA